MINLTYDFIEELSNEFGDSFYIVDVEKLKKDIETFDDAFRARLRNEVIAYSFKTCFLSSVLDIVKECGCRAEITSEYEYVLAKGIGFSDAEIVYNGPYKQMGTVSNIIKNGGIVNIDSLYESKKLCSYYSENRLTFGNIGIRCNFSIGSSISRFGIDFESNDVTKAIIMLQEAGFKVNCLHCHLKAKSEEQWRDKINYFCSKINNIYRSGYLPNLEYIDFGGGYQYNSSDLYAKMISEAVEEYGLAHLTVITEPGAAIAEGSMLFVAKIVNKNVIQNKKFAVFAGCTEDISAIRRRPPAKVSHFSKHRRNNNATSICGFTCLEDDIICDYPYELEVGDYIVFHDVGAYSSALRSNFIRSHPPVLVYQNGISLSRSQGSKGFYLNSSGFVGCNR